MASATGRVGVAVVGLGVGAEHARAYLRTGRCDLIWLHDLDGAKAKALASQLGTGRVAESFEQVLDDPHVDVVSIATYDDAHFDQVVAALDADKHVFVEKPLCRTLGELSTVKQAWCRGNGRLKLSSNLVLRQAPVYQWLKDKIEGGELGQVYAFDGDYLFGRLHKITDEWRKDVDDYSVILGGSVHLIDLMLWLTDERPERVHAAGNRICTEGTEFRYNDFVAATLTTPSGMVARITANFGCIHRHQHVVRVFGANGTFVYDDSGARLHSTRDPSVKAEYLELPTLPTSKGALIEPFVSAVLDDDDLTAHTQEMFDVVSICAACDSAAASGTLEEIRYV